MKWRIARIVGLVLGLALVTGLAFYGRQAVEVSGVSRSEVARAVALLQVSPQQCREAAWESRFEKEDQGQWFAKYADYLYEQSLWTTVETPANEASLTGDYTYAELWGLLERAGCESRWTSRGEADWDKAVPRTVWEKVWEELREALDPNGAVTETTLLIYGTPTEMEGLAAWTAATSAGLLEFEGLNLNGCVDREVQVWVRDGAIIRLGEVVSREILYENVLITRFAAQGDAGSQLAFFVDGVEKNYFLSGQMLTETYEMVLADVVVRDGAVAELKVKQESITGKVLAVRDDVIEIQGYGEVPRVADLKVYRIYNGVAMQGIEDIRLGGETQRFMVAEGRICGVLTEQAPKATSIRVLLKTNHFAAVAHDRVEVTSDQNFTVSYGEQTDVYQAGQVAAWSSEDAVFAEGRVTVEPVDGGRLQVLTLERAGKTPSYGGRLELLAADGGIVLINELLLEDYLALVLPSEMPESYGLEALKAQAVCARSYAYRQMAGHAYSQYGAHVDDSSSYQVYNNSPASALAAQATQETYGQVLTYQGEVITTFYFSTSCGHTTDGTAWGGNTEQYPYLAGQWLCSQAPDLDLRDEASFRQFIMQMDESAYEASFPWYRWRVTVPLQTLNDQINAYLAEAGTTETVLVQQEDGSFASGNIGSIGALTGAAVLQRGEGGVAEVLELTGTKGCVRVLRQNTIRQILGGPGYIYMRNGDEHVSQSEMLPSGYIYLEPQYTGDLLSGYTIYGGGSGHGVGMSQNAACHLARIGKTYDDILAQFYKDCILARLY